MGRNHNNCPRLNSHDVINAAERGGLKVKECHGRHFKIEGSDGTSMTAYHGEMSIGVSCKIRKWLLKFAIVLTLFLGMLAYLYC